MHDDANEDCADCCGSGARCSGCCAPAAWCDCPSDELAPLRFVCPCTVTDRLV